MAGDSYFVPNPYDSWRNGAVYGQWPMGPRNLGARGRGAELQYLHEKIKNSELKHKIPYSYHLNKHGFDSFANGDPDVRLNELLHLDRELRELTKQRHAESMNAVSPVDPKVDLTKQYLHEEKQRVNQLPFANYQGERLAPKSELTKRAETLQDKYSQKLPYTSKIADLRARQQQNIGLTGQDKQAINDFLKEHEGQYQDKSVNFLQRNFRKPYEAGDQQRFIQRNQKKVHEADAVKQQELNDFAQVLAANQNLQDTKKIELLQKFGNMKTQDRNSLISLLQQGGNTEASIGNMSLEATQRNFQNQLAQPIRDVAHLEQGLAPHFAYDEAKKQDTKAGREHALRRQAVIESGASDIGPYQSDMGGALPPHTNIDEIMNVYKKRKGEGHNYPNMQVAGMNDELKNTLAQIYGLDIHNSPEFKNEINKMIGSNEEASGKITGSALDSIRARTASSDKSARKELKHQARVIGNQYAGRGEYNSPSHIAEVERLMALGNQNRNDERHKGVLSSLTNQSETSQYADKTQLMNTQLAALRQQLENNNIFHNLQNKHKLGANRFNVAQDALDRQYIDDVMRHDYQFPHLRDVIVGQGFNNAPLNRQNYGVR